MSTICGNVAHAAFEQAPRRVNREPAKPPADERERSRGRCCGARGVQRCVKGSAALTRQLALQSAALLIVDRAATALVALLAVLATQRAVDSRRPR
jgi:hypothetical protein